MHWMKMFISFYFSSCQQCQQLTVNVKRRKGVSGVASAELDDLETIKKNRLARKNARQAKRRAAISANRRAIFLPPPVSVKNQQTLEAALDSLPKKMAELVREMIEIQQLPINNRVYSDAMMEFNMILQVLVLVFCVLTWLLVCLIDCHQLL
jgi:hypothetical protein